MHNRLALLGASLALESIGAALAAIPDIELRRISGSSDCGWLRDDIDALIFDLSTGLPGYVLLNLVTCPALMLVGLDLETRKTLLLSGKPGRLATMNDLLATLELSQKRAEQAADDNVER
jgi:hypothetical protein